MQIEDIILKLQMGGDITDKERGVAAMALRIVQSISGGAGPFICGHAGDKDDFGLPEYMLVCPTPGLDGVATYRKVTDYSAPGY